MNNNNNNNNNKNIYFILIVFINLINLVYSITSPPQLISPIRNPLNGHYYQSFNWTSANGEKITGPVARTECSSYTYNGLKGYLVTFTSSEEWEWARLNGLTLAGAFISGSDLEKTGVWKHSIGSPEEDDFMYNLYFDKCYSFCIFGSLEPNLIKDEHYLHTSGSATEPYVNNVGPLSLMDRFVCEFGGLEEPHIPTSPTAGSTVRIKYLDIFQLDGNLEIKFTNLANTAKTFTCLSINIIDSTQLDCEIPAGQGKFNVTIKDSNNKQLSQPIHWHYELPMIGGVYPVFNKDQTATITGANFGSISSEIIVTLGVPGVPCTNINITKDNEVFTCKLSADLTGNKFLPITITVSTNVFISFKAAIFYNGFYYSGFLAWATFEVSMNDYANNLRIDGQIGHMGSLYDRTLIDFANRTLPIQTGGTARWGLWQNAKYIGNNNFVYINGPNQGKPCDLKYNSIRGGDTMKATWDEETRFLIYLDNLELTNMTISTSTGVLTEYGGIPPSFTTVNSIHEVDTSGGKVDIAIDNYGTIFSNIETYFNNSVVSFDRDYINGELDLKIPAGFDGPYEVSVKVDSLTTAPNSQFVKYAAPNITSMNKVPTSGATVTITGTSFSNSLSNTLLQFENCASLTLLVPYKSYTCQLPAGTGSIPVLLKVSNQNTTSTYYYAEPSINYSNNIPRVGGLLSIDGSNFGTNNNSITILVVGGTDNVNVNCKRINITIPHTSITCIAPPLSPDIYNLKVIVDGIASLEPQYKLTYFESDLGTDQENADLLIVGKNLPDSSKLSITLGLVNISPYCKGSGTLINCTNLPLETVSGDLSIVNGDEIYPTIQVTLKPWISSISKQLLDTVQETNITIKGRYFENPIRVIRDEIHDLRESVDYTFISPEEIILHVNGGYGANHSISIENQNQLKSNLVSYSFERPELLTVEQDKDLIIITGRNFSKDLTVLTFGNYQPTLKLIEINRIEFELSNQQSRNGEIYVIVDSQISNSLTLEIKPYLTSISPIEILFNKASKIIINGNYLFEKDSNQNPVQLEFNYKFNTPSDISSPKGSLSNCIELVEGISYECDAVYPGYGKFEISAVSKSKYETNSITSQYESPTVLKVLSQVYLNEPIELVISVNNFKIEYTTVFIEDQECTNVTAIDQSTIKCNYLSTIPLPEDRDGLNVKVISAELSGDNDCLIYSTLYDCEHLNNCSNHGKCNRKLPKCICDNGWRGERCDIDSSIFPPLPEPPIIDENGTTTFPGSKINFTVAITHLVEMNLSNKPVRYLSLSDIEWINKTALSTTSNFYSGNFNKVGDSSTIFQLIIHYFENEDQIEFAGESLYMPSNSIKYQATILNWKFASKANYLITIFNSNTDSSEVYNCDNYDTTSKLYTNQYLIETYSSSLTGKFASRAIIDTRIIKTSLIQIDKENNNEIYNFIKAGEIDDLSTSKLNLRTGVISPYFEQQTIIDPSFGQLLRPYDDTQEQEDTQCNKSNWKLPVIIVLSVVGGSSIIAATSFFYYKKTKENKSMKRISVSMNSMNG